MSSVIFEGDVKNIGKMLKVKIDKVNQNSLFGKFEKKDNKRAA
jgi:tRNA-2-methylthio-N6-dimethylallyladenosine synthase